MSRRSFHTNVLEYFENLTKPIDYGHNLQIIYSYFANELEKSNPKYIPESNFISVSRRFSLKSEDVNKIPLFGREGFP